MRQQRFLV